MEYQDVTKGGVEYCVFMLLEEQNGICYRIGLGSMFKKELKAAAPSFSWASLG